MRQRAKSFRSKGQLDSAAALYEKMLRSFDDDESGLTHAGVLFELSDIYDTQGHQQEAVETMHRSMNYFRRVGSDSGEAVVNEAVAVMHWKQQKPELALTNIMAEKESKVIRALEGVLSNGRNLFIKEQKKLYKVAIDDI